MITKPDTTKTKPTRVVGRTPKRPTMSGLRGDRATRTAADGRVRTPASSGE